MGQFQPVRADGRPYWRVIFEYIDGEMAAQRLNVGDILKHKDLLDEADLADRTAVYYQAVDRAAWELKAERSRSLRSIKGVGYQIVHGEAIVDEGRRRQKKSQRGLKKAVTAVRAVNRADLPSGFPIDQIITGLVAIHNMAKMTAEKVEEHEREIAQLKTARMVDRAKSVATDEQVAAMREQLAALEKRLDEQVPD